MQTQTGGSATSFAPSKPTANASGKTLLAVYYTEVTTAITMPTGFANKLDVTFGVGRLRVDYKIADGTEGATLTWSWTGSNWRMGCLFCIDNAQTSGDPTEFGTTATSSGVTNPPAVALTSNASVDDLVFIGGANTAATTATWGAPASWTLEQSFTGDDMGVGSIAQASGGKPGSTNMTDTGNTTGNVGSVIIAVKSPASFDPATVPWPAQVPDPVQVQLVEF